MLRKREEQKIKFEKKANQGRCKSAPAIPSFCENSTSESCSEEDEKPKKSGPDNCVSPDKYPCGGEESESEEEVKLKISKKCPSKREKNRRSATPAKPQKKGFFAKCCSCCVKKPIARPVSKACGPKNVKQTQTDPADLKRALKCYKEAIKEEMRRQKAYGKDKKSKGKNDCASIRKSSEKQFEDRDRVSEAEYIKAREKYRQNRKKMEEKINKSLENEKKKQKKC